MPAYSTTSGKSDSFRLNKGKSSSGGKNNSGNRNGSSKKGKDKSGSKNTKKTNTLLDKFSKYLEKLFDWIEVRLDRIQRRIDLFTAQAENALTYGDKNTKINSAMGQIARDAGEVSRVTIQRDANGTVTGQTGAVEGTLLSDSALGAVRYQQQANAVLAAAQKKNKKGKSLINANQAADIADKVARGVIDINSYPEKIRKVIEAYKEW